MTVQINLPKMTNWRITKNLRDLYYYLFLTNSNKSITDFVSKSPTSYVFLLRT